MLRYLLVEANEAPKLRSRVVAAVDGPMTRGNVQAHAWSWRWPQYTSLMPTRAQQLGWLILLVALVAYVFMRVG